MHASLVPLAAVLKETAVRVVTVQAKSISVTFVHLLQGCTCYEGSTAHHCAIRLLD